MSVIYHDTVLIYSVCSVSAKSYGKVKGDSPERRGRKDLRYPPLHFFCCCVGYADLPTNFFQNVWFCHPIYISLPTNKACQDRLPIYICWGAKISQLLNLLGWKCVAKVIKVSGISSKVSGKSAQQWLEWHWMNEWQQTHLVSLLSQKLRKVVVGLMYSEDTPNVTCVAVGRHDDVMCHSHIRGLPTIKGTYC